MYVEWGRKSIKGPDANGPAENTSIGLLLILGFFSILA